MDFCVWCKIEVQVYFFVCGYLISQMPFIEEISPIVYSWHRHHKLVDCMHARVLSHFSRVRLFVTPWSLAHQTPLSMGFSRQEYWSGCQDPPGDLPDPGIEPRSPESPVLQADSLLLSHQRNPSWLHRCGLISGFSTLFHWFMCLFIMPVSYSLIILAL